jgi:endonuclease/exonuclease/phosphatase family metal-dependent hydrolase
MKTGALIGTAVGLLLAVAPRSSIADSDALMLRVLSYNVHGLPQIAAGDSPVRRLPKIAKLIGERYDIALLQENFEYPHLVTDNLGDARHEHYHGGRDLVAAGFGQRLAQTLLLAPSGLFLGIKMPNLSGLTTIASGSKDFTMSPLVNEPYVACEGYLFDKNDCLATKGYLGMRVSGPDGLAIDVYNTHLDARSGSSSNRGVRRKQLAQLVTAVRRHSQGRAVIVAGDFNTGHQRPKDFALLKSFRALLGLADSGARRDRSWNGEADVDYILYRSGVGTRLSLDGADVSAGEDRSFRWPDDRVRLSDHPAIFARFKVEATP